MNAKIRDERLFVYDAYIRITYEAVKVSVDCVGWSKSGKTEGGEGGEDSPWFQWWSTERSLIWYAAFKAWMVKSIFVPFYINVRHKWYCFSWETVTSNTKGYVRSYFRYAIFLRGLGGGGWGWERGGRGQAYRISNKNVCRKYEVKKAKLLDMV